MAGYVIIRDVKIVIDSAAHSLILGEGQSEHTIDLFSKAAFDVLSLQWIQMGQAIGYHRNFSWFGHRVLHLPEDLIRLQEVVCRLRPDVIVETGVSGGGLLLFNAMLCQALGSGRVIGIDRDIDSGAREASGHRMLGSRISLVKGDSTSRDVINSIDRMIAADESVLVILGSRHTEEIAQELELYSRFVTSGSYILAAGGNLDASADVQGGLPVGVSHQPSAAVTEFAAGHPQFRQKQPRQPIENNDISGSVSYWPDAWLERLV